ncbi:MAG: DUF262 domain-containing protein [Pyrinomonadaceae bacterium]|nr:DUF262 domain-containing protein [Pyrinomonadaceae bacterium]
MSIFEDTNPRELKELLADIHGRNMVLPDFQRDFVWDPAATQELIVSIANNFPAGSLLRVRDTRGMYFAPREFQGAPALDGSRHTFLVLDGQQRLTSLYQAFFGVGDHRYYLDLKKLLDGGEFEDAIFHLRTTTKKVKAYDNFETQANEYILPLSELKDGSGGFSTWVRKFGRLYPDKRDQFEDALAEKEIEKRWVQPIDDYKFPVVTLAETTTAEALCTIFETLNRTGVKLTVFELLTARFWPKGVKLRDLWDQAKADYPIIDEFGVDAYYLLQAIALCSRTAPSCTKSDVLALSADDINQWWPQVVKGLAIGLTILRDDCKVMLPKWLPYGPMLITLPAVLAKAETAGTPVAGANREKLKRWFWCAVFGQSYERAANTQATKDFRELLVWFGGGAEPESVSGVRFDPAALRDVTPNQISLYRGTICLILGNGARDFHTQAVITANLMAQEGIDDHHIFPDNFLKKNGVESARSRNCVLNRTLIDAKTNRTISNRAPSDYLKEIKDTPGFPFNEVLDSHHLPAGDDSPFWSDNFEAFLEFRLDRLWREIKRVTGIIEASDLEDEGVDAAPGVSTATDHAP